MPDPSTRSGHALAAALRRHLLQRFPADRAYPRAALHAEGMPPLVAAFLDRTLDRWVEIERAAFRSAWFDFDDAEVQRAEEPFFEALSRAARVPAAAWEETLGGTVDLVVRFLTMPARALTDAIFEGEAAPLPAAEVRTRLSMFEAYPYLAEVATAYLDRKQPDTLDPDALFGLLDRIDRRVVSEYGREDWLDLLAPLFDLARYAPALDGVPAVRLQRFFEAKGEADLADLLAEHTGSVLDEAQLRDVLAPAFPEPTPAEPEPAEPAAVPSEPAESEADEPAPAPPPSPAEEPEPESAAETSSAAPPAPEPSVSEPPAPTPAPPAEPEEATPEDEEPTLSRAPHREDVSPSPREEPPSREETPSLEEPSRPEPTAAASDEESLPLWQRFAERTSDGDSVNARFGGEDPDDHPRPANEETTVPLWKRFFAREDDAAPLPPPPADAPSAPSTPTPARAETPARADSLDALEEAVLGPTSPAQRKRFIKHLFGGDAGKYATVLHTLDGAGSWTEASQIIARDVFRPSRVNIYGEHAVAFTDAVEARFRT